MPFHIPRVVHFIPPDSFCMHKTIRGESFSEIILFRVTDAFLTIYLKGPQQCYRPSSSSSLAAAAAGRGFSSSSSAPPGPTLFDACALIILQQHRHTMQRTTTSAKMTPKPIARPIISCVRLLFGASSSSTISSTGTCQQFQTQSLTMPDQTQFRSFTGPGSLCSLDADGVDQWLGRRSLAGGLSLICALSMVDI